MLRLLFYLSIFDLLLTYIYIYKYKRWQPEKPYKKMEANPLLYTLFNYFGLTFGMIMGGTIILMGIYIVYTKANIIFSFILFAVLILSSFKTMVNIHKLNFLINKYPKGGKNVRRNI